MKNDPTLKVSVRPSFRPDKAINVELSWFASWVKQLAGVVGYEINSLNDIKELIDNNIFKNNKTLILGGGSNILFTDEYFDVHVLFKDLTLPKLLT